MSGAGTGCTAAAAVLPAAPSTHNASISCGSDITEVPTSSRQLSPSSSSALQQGVRSAAAQEEERAASKLSKQLPPDVGLAGLGGAGGAVPSLPGSGMRQLPSWPVLRAKQGEEERLVEFGRQQSGRQQAGQSHEPDTHAYSSSMSRTRPLLCTPAQPLTRRSAGWQGRGLRPWKRPGGTGTAPPGPTGSCSRRRCRRRRSRWC